MHTPLSSKPNPLSVSHDSLFKNRRFVFLWITNILSNLAVSMYLLSEQWYIVKVLNFKASLGIVMMATMIPRVIFMIIGGVFADRINKTMIMAISSLTRAILIFAMVFLLMDHLLGLLFLIAFALIFGMIDAFFNPANISMLPSIINKEKLTRANSMIQGSIKISMMTGPVITGLILSMGSFILSFMLIGILLTLCSVFAFFLKDTTTKINNRSISPVQSLKVGIDYIRASPKLRELMFLLALINFFFFGPLLMGIPIFVDDVLKGNALELSYLQGSYESGMLLGALINGVIYLNRKRGIVILFSVFLLGSLLSLFGESRSLWQGVVILIVMGLSSSVVNIMIITLIQQETRPELLGRVMSFLIAVSNGLLPLSYGCLTLFVSLNLSITYLFFISGIVISSLCIVFWFKSQKLRGLN